MKPHIKLSKFRPRKELNGHRDWVAKAPDSTTQSYGATPKEALDRWIRKVQRRRKNREAHEARRRQGDAE